MVKGHMQDGKFHPHTDYKKGIRKSRDQSIKTEGVKIRFKKNVDGSQFKKIKVWKYEDASKDLKTTILENWKIKYSGNDTFFSEDDFLLGVDKKGEPLFQWAGLLWDLDSFGEIHFKGLVVANEPEFFTKLKIPEKLWNEFEYRLQPDTNLVGRSESSPNEIKFMDAEDQSIILEFGTLGGDTFERFTKKDIETFEKAKKIFDEMIEDGWRNLEKNFDGEFDDERIIDQIEANDYTFNEEGDIENL